MYGAKWYLSKRFIKRNVNISHIVDSRRMMTDPERRTSRQKHLQTTFAHLTAAVLVVVAGRIENAMIFVPRNRMQQAKGL